MCGTARRAWRRSAGSPPQTDRQRPRSGPPPASTIQDGQPRRFILCLVLNCAIKEDFYLSIKRPILTRPGGFPMLIGDIHACKLLLKSVDSYLGQSRQV